jgi:CheY-like chemotaxis protein
MTQAHKTVVSNSSEMVDNSSHVFFEMVDNVFETPSRVVDRVQRITRRELRMTTQPISLLLVGERCVEIENLLHHTHWRVCRADSAAEAIAMLKRVPVQVILCQHSLRDGTWVNVLKAAEECHPAPPLVVLSKLDDHTWAEVVCQGAYDVLPLPCSAPELYAIIPMAWRHCIQQEHPVTAAG